MGVLPVCAEDGSIAEGWSNTVAPVCVSPAVGVHFLGLRAFAESKTPCEHGQFTGPLIFVCPQKGVVATSVG